MINFAFLLCLLKLATCGDTGRQQFMVFINDQELMKVPETKQQSIYDYTANYKYTDGELAKFTCTRNNTIYNWHNIFYQDKENQYTVKGEISNTTSLYIKLKKYNLPSYIDCDITKLWKFQTTNITIRVKLSEDEKDYPKFKVNRLPLSPLIPRNEYNLTYFYEYYIGEHLNISFDFGDRRLNSIRCNSADPKISTNVNDISSNNLKVISLNTEEFVDTDVLSFNCSMKLNNHMYDMKLKLVRNEIAPTQITGVSSSRLLSKFTNSNPIHEKIFYPYYNNETLVLNCSTTNAKWKFNPKEVSNTPILTPDSYDSDFYVDAQSFQLRNGVNTSVLNCTQDDPTSQLTSQIVLMRSEDHKDESVTVTTPPVIVSDISTNAYEFNNDSPENNGGLDNKMYYIIIVAVIAVIILTIILITLIFCKMKKEIHQKAESDINYDNLPEHNEGTMSMPSQWNKEYANTTEVLYNNVNNEPTYAKPVPKSIRNMLNETYSEPQTTNDNSCEYATPYNTQSPYAEIIPPSQKNLNCKFDSSPQNANYAQVIPKSQRNNVNLNKVLPTPDGYAEIDHIRSRADTDKNKYENVFDKERYMNANPSDYIEPAYASIDCLK